MRTADGNFALKLQHTGLQCRREGRQAQFNSRKAIYPIFKYFTLTAQLEETSLTEMLKRQSTGGFSEEIPIPDTG